MLTAKNSHPPQGGYYPPQQPGYGPPQQPGYGPPQVVPLLALNNPRAKK